MKDLTQKLPDQKQKPEAPVFDSNKPSAAAGGFPYQVQVQTSDSPSHDFSPYYHFYHHPKIPLPGSQDSSSGLESSTNPHSFRFPAVSDVQQASDASQQSSPPKTPPYPDTIPIKYKPPAPYPSHFLPYYLYSYPPTARGEARRLGLINPHLVANLSYFHTYSAYDKSSINARIKQAEVDQTEDFSNTKPDLDERHSSSVTPAPQPPVPPRYPPKPKLAAAPLPEQSSVYRPNSYQYFYHPFYGYYLVYYPPAAWSGTNTLSRTNPYSPAVPLCGFGLLLDPDCTNHLSCCSHTFKDGIPEQYFVFAVPDSVLEPSLLSAGNNTSCSPQRLTSDLAIFIVPVEGCGVNKHMLGHTVVHLLEVHGTESSKEGKAAAKSPVRMTVGCSSSPTFQVK
ncbi:hypothetical protein OJAV_G00074570 [Oryzias javanicus]|uniref:ZP domain-containing protein n=1 Tax=Oryzias javanicus TaxID=123683 RepID=A0A3S2PKF3_ORYJA|nr:hypothetical protein OJAV_G00074570 [Oryzias javanicus]